MEWKRALEGKIDKLQLELSDLCSLLGETCEVPASGITLLQKAQDLEASISSMLGVKESRINELHELTAQVENLHMRLHESLLSTPLPVPEDQGALHSSTLAKVQERLRYLESHELERQKLVAERFEQLQQLWGAVGLEVPEDLEPMEKALLQGPLSVSDSVMVYVDSRKATLTNWRDNLEPEESALQGRLAELHKQLSPLGVNLPDAPVGLPLLPCIKVLRSLVAAAEITAKEFVLQQRVSLQNFADATQLENVCLACIQLQDVNDLSQELSILGSHWERLCSQFAEHRRILELVAARENLEDEVRHFDAQASGPDRFRKRGYSGVQENKVRTDYQRRLRMLDASLQQSMGDWSQREGVPFCKEGAEYRGAEMLPSDHTHMYAWPSKQVTQKKAVATIGLSPTAGSYSPRSSSTQMPSARGRPSTGSGSPRAAPLPTPRTSRGGASQAQSPSSRVGTPLSTARTSTGSARSPTSSRGQTGSQSARRRLSG
jgi:hypothetical protein